MILALTRSSPSFVTRDRQVAADLQHAKFEARTATSRSRFRYGGVLALHLDLLGVRAAIGRLLTPQDDVKLDGPSVDRGRNVRMNGSVSDDDYSNNSNSTVCTGAGGQAGESGLGKRLYKWNARFRRSTYCGPVVMIIATK
jgi:hypothetical protein